MSNLKKYVAALSAACLVMLGVIGSSTAASATQTPVCVPQDAVAAYDETVTEAYDDPPIVVHEAYNDPDTTVIDSAAVDKWYSWTGGPAADHPAPPAGTWQVDNGNHSGFDQSPGLLQRDKGNSGESDWFYHVVIAEQSHVVPGDHHDAVTAPGDHHDAVIVHHDAVPAVTCDTPPTILSEWHTWQTPTWFEGLNGHVGYPDGAFPQSYVGPGQLTPEGCEVTYQQDLYVGTRAEIDAVLDDDTLEGPPPEDSSIVEDWNFVSTDACPPGDRVVPVQFDIEADQPTCEDPGFLDTSVFPIERDGYTLTVSPTEFVGPGDYVITATADDGVVFEGPGDPTVRTATVHVGERLEEGCVPPECVEGQQPVWHVWTGGPQENAPDVDDPKWNATSGNPQSENHTVPPREYGVPYFVSHGGSGNGDWFLWTLEDSEDCQVPPDLIEVTPSVWIDDQCGTDNDTYEFGDEVGITYHEDGTVTADEGYILVLDPNGLFSANEDGSATFQVDAAFTNEPCTCETECGPFPTGIPFSTPTPAPTCTTGATFNAASLGGVFDAESGRWDFPNVSVEVLSTSTSVTLNVFANEGFVIEATPAQIASGWFVESGGARASITIPLAAATGTQSTNAAAPCYVPPGITPPPGTTPVVLVTTPTHTVFVAANTSDAVLASTGSEGTWALAGIAGLLLLIGGSATVLSVRRK